MISLTHIKSKSNLDVHLLLCLALLSFCFALISPDWATWLNDYQAILWHQTYLTHDFIEIGGIAATFMNVVCHLLLAYMIYLHNQIKHLSGLQIAAVAIFVGHCFFGTHLLNVGPIIIGVFAYAKWRGQPLKYFTASCLFSTSTAPLVSFWMLSPQLTLTSFIGSMCIGLLMGFIITPIAEHVLKFHQGYTVYNFGFATGMTATFFSMLIPYFHQVPESLSYISHQAHTYLLSYLILICLVLLAYGISTPSELKVKYPRLLKATGRTPDDFVAKFGLKTTAFNMGMTCLIYLFIVLLIGYPLNGPSTGGLITILGFSAFGVHPKNALPLSLGVILAASLRHISLHSLTFMLPFLFATGLAPITGSFGWYWGILAGFLHFNMATNVFTLHKGMSLYNNGFSTGFVAAFLVPLIEMINEHFEKDDF